MLIIVKDRKKSPEWSGAKKDYLHKRRKELESDLKDGIFSVGQMMMRDCATEADEAKRVSDYDKWKAKKENKMREWSDINREFKKHGEEGRPHDLDDLRKDKSVKYD